MSYPSLENASAFRDSIPINPQKGLAEKIQNLIFLKGYRAEVSQGYEVLEREAMSGNRYAAEALFRIYNLSPGGIDTIELQNSLSRLIRINPKLFLSSLGIYRAVLGREWIEGIIRFPPIPYYWDSQVVHEYKMRREALESVVDPQVQELRDFCIEDLKGIIEIRERSLKRLKIERFSGNSDSDR